MFTRVFAYKCKIGFRGHSSKIDESDSAFVKVVRTWKFNEIYIDKHPWQSINIYFFVRLCISNIRSAKDFCTIELYGGFTFSLYYLPCRALCVYYLPRSTREIIVEPHARGANARNFRLPMSIWSSTIPNASKIRISYVKKYIIISSSNSHMVKYAEIALLKNAVPVNWIKVPFVDISFMVFFYTYLQTKKRSTGTFSWY